MNIYTVLAAIPWAVTFTFFGGVLYWAVGLALHLRRPAESDPYWHYTHTEV